MKVLTATTRTNGQHSQDYAFCFPGELLWIPDDCDADRNQSASSLPCGCSLGFGGLNSHRATTTAEVSESQISRAGVEEAIRSSLTDQGWLPPLVPLIDQQAIVDEVLEEIINITEHFPLGCVIRRNGDQVYTEAPGQRR